MSEQDQKDEAVLAKVEIKSKVRTKAITATTILQFGFGLIGIGSVLVDGKRKGINFREFTEHHNIGVLPEDQWHDECYEGGVTFVFHNIESIDCLIDALLDLKDTFEGDTDSIEKAILPE